MSDQFATLSTDLTERILSLLPIPSLLRASLSCKLFHSVISSPTFPCSPPHSLPWFFLCGLHNTSSKNNQSFAFDPSSSAWFRLPSPPLSSPHHLAASSSSGFLFSTTSSSSFSSSSSLLNPIWSHFPPLNFPRLNPLLAVISPSPSFLVAGGVRFIGCLVDIEESLSLEIFDPNSQSWLLFPPLPHGLASGFSSQTLSSALFNEKFYVLGIHSLSISAFDLKSRSWGPLLTLRTPPGSVMFSFLIACSDALVLAGMCCGPPHRFTLWRVDAVSMESIEIGVMPEELLFGLVDVEEDDKFASLKCIGMGNLVYVFNEEYHKRYPACVCEIGFGGGGNVCRWSKVPPLPSPVNKFHKVISFCSTVSPRDVFPPRIQDSL